MWLIILSIVIICFIYIKLIKPYGYWKQKNISQVKPWPIVGNLGPLMLRQRAVTDLTQDIYNAYPNERYFGMYQFMLPMLVIRDLDLLKRIMVKDFETFPEHRLIVPEDVDPLFGKSIFTMRGGERWHDMRSTLSPAFTSSKMRTMFGLMRQCASQFIAHFEKENGQVSVEMRDVFSKYANDVIATAAFGVTCDSLENPQNEFYLMGKNVTTVSLMKGLSLFLYTISPTIMQMLKVKVASDKVSTYFMKVIKETLEIRREKGIIRPDMIHLLMEAQKGRLKHDDQNDVIDTGFAVVEESEIGKAHRHQKVPITDEDIAAQAFVFFLAGFDSSSTAMSFTAHELAVNPEIQEKLRKEVDGVLKNGGGAPVTYEALLGMKYMDLVITESLRKWPPILFTDRKSVKPFTIEPEFPGEKRVELEAGTVCWIPIYPIHRDPNYYPNPDKFDPERFNDENKHLIKPFSYLPFGAGPKNCIGSRFALLEVKLILFYILSKFEIVPVEKTQIPLKISKNGFFLSAEKGIWLGFKPRNN